MILLLADWKEGAQISERVRALASQILSVGKGLGAALQPFNSLKTQVGAKPLAWIDLHGKGQYEAVCQYGGHHSLLPSCRSLRKRDLRDPSVLVCRLGCGQGIL